MSRHRDVRCMNYSEEYEGYDDVYGHSVEDDYCVSPSAEQFLFDRSKQQNIASFITEPDIVEANEDSDDAVTPSKEEDVVLTEFERAKLMSCMESIRTIIGDTIPDSEIKKKILQSNFDAEAALDLVLKESPPKNVIEPSTNTKDNLQHHPDDTTIKPQTTSFVIPKLSFKKQNNIDATTNMSLKHNVESLKNLSISSSPMKFSSLSELISNHAKSSSSTTEKSQVNSNAMPFNSLADLTAHHLQKSTSLMNNISSNDKPSSSSTNFVIPKLSIKKDKNSDLNNTLESLVLQRNRDIKLDSIDDKEKDHFMDSLEKSILNVLSFTEDAKQNSHSLETKDGSLLNLSDARTPSPDTWMIDLSSALKEVTCLVSDDRSQTKSNILTSNSNNMPKSNSHVSKQNIEISHIFLPTALNLSCLRNVKLPHTKTNVSLFGRTLCRAWKSKKPVLKYQEQQYGTVKRFDFSVPYSRNNRTK